MTIKLSKGNKKLISNKDTKFLIFSIPPQSTCPYATEHCKSACYAMKAWKAYPNVRKAWTNNYIETLRDDFIDNMINAIEKEANKPSYKNAKEVVVRIHESGDFYSRLYVYKWLVIARHFASKHNNKVRFMAYTKSVKFFGLGDYGFDLAHLGNVTVRFSLWDDTPAMDAFIAKRIAMLPTYTAVDKFTTEPSKERCACVDCGHCRKCWNKSINMIKCEIH